MTVLSACQSALVRLVGRRPSTVFSSQEQTVVEVAELVTEVAIDIMKGNEWQALTEFHEITADGASAYAFPSDYDRMIEATDIYDPNTWCWGYQHITDYGQWINHVSRGMNISPGAWIIRKNQFHFSPAPAVGQMAIFPYISNHIALSGTGTPKDNFDKDDDTFVLEDRLLTLGLIWRWRAQKRLEYAEDLQTYELALSQAQARDKGSRVIRHNGSRLPAGAVNAWPWELGAETP